MISSLQNPKVKKAYHLFKRRERDETNLFLIEGYRELLRAYEGNVEVETLFSCEALFLGSNEHTLIYNFSKKGVAHFATEEKVFRRLSYRDRPDGLLAIARQMHPKLEDLSLKPNPLLLVAEAIEKPGNLGTILRSADACGADGVIVCDKCTDLYNPNVVRASVGTLFTLPIIEETSLNTLEWLEKNQILTVAATPSATTLYYDIDLTGPIALIVGTEQLGLSPLWLEKAAVKAKIPMLGRADSLNVATATTLLLYEALRQRREQ